MPPFEIDERTLRKRAHENTNFVPHCTEFVQRVRQMDSSSVAHRKIELQTPEDFTYLINNVRRAAAESVNAAFPPVEGSEGDKDDLHSRIEELVNEVSHLHILYATPTRPVTPPP